MKYGVFDRTGSLVRAFNTFEGAETFKTYWIKKKVTDHKYLRIADSHAAKKLIRIIYYLETNQINFDSSLCK